MVHLYEVMAEYKVCANLIMEQAEYDWTKVNAMIRLRNISNVSFRSFEHSVHAQHF